MINVFIGISCILLKLLIFYKEDFLCRFGRMFIVFSFVVLMLNIKKSYLLDNIFFKIGFDFIF